MTQLPLQHSTASQKNGKKIAPGSVRVEKLHCIVRERRRFWTCSKNSYAVSFNQAILGASFREEKF